MPKAPNSDANHDYENGRTENDIPVGDQEVQMDRRWRNRRSEDQGESNSDSSTDGVEDETRKFNPPRRRKQRRRQIDPTTCERDYNDEEIRFMRAMDDYKRDSGRMFPTCSEILEVVRSLGYTKLNEEEQQILLSIQQVEDDLHEATRPTEDETQVAESTSLGLAEEDDELSKF
jgi:hypothetical protein